MSVKSHYDDHLSNFYVWLSGDFTQRSINFQHFLEKQLIYPNNNGVAIDLGAGHGIQSIALKNIGFSVTAIDFSQQLLDNFRANSNSESIQIINEDITSFKNCSPSSAELIICCGDTLLHLENKASIEQLIHDIASVLNQEGKVILSFRDYSTLVANEQVFIPVKSDDKRILTCIIEAKSEKVKVTDLLYEKINDSWHQKVSTYYKTKISSAEIAQILKNTGLSIKFNELIRGMHTLIAQKSNS